MSGKRPQVQRQIIYVQGLRSLVKLSNTNEPRDLSRPLHLYARVCPMIRVMYLLRCILLYALLALHAATTPCIDSQAAVPLSRKLDLDEDGYRWRGCFYDDEEFRVLPDYPFESDNMTIPARPHVSMHGPLMLPEKFIDRSQSYLTAVMKHTYQTHHTAAACYFLCL